MTITIEVLDRGTVEGDKTGEGPFSGTGKTNDNFAALKGAGETQQGRFWTLDNTARSLALGERVVVESHSGITHTLPANFVRSATAFSDVWLWNADSNSNLALDPNGTDELFIAGTGQGAGVSLSLLPNEIAICSPRVGNVSWDIFVIQAKEHTHGSYDRSTSGLLGNSVFSDIVVVDGIVQSISQRNVSASNIGAEPEFSKNGAFNKDFGSGNNTVCEGDDARLSNDRDPTTHTHTFTSLTSKPTTMAGYSISDTKANFNTALSNGTFLFSGDVVGDTGTPAIQHNGGTPVLQSGSTAAEIRSLLGVDIAGTINYNHPAVNSSNMHLDWSTDRGATNIHANNYVNTVYSHPTTAGNKHLPTGGAVGQELENSASGTGVWVNRKWDKSITIEAPADGDDITWFYTDRAITVTSIRLVGMGSNVSSIVSIKVASDRKNAGQLVDTNTVTSETTGHDVTAISDATIDAGRFVWIEIGATSNTDQVHITMFGTVDS